MKLIVGRGGARSSWDTWAWCVDEIDSLLRGLLQ